MVQDELPLPQPPEFAVFQPLSLFFLQSLVLWVSGIPETAWPHVRTLDRR